MSLDINFNDARHLAEQILGVREMMESRMNASNELGALNGRDEFEIGKTDDKYKTSKYNFFINTEDGEILLFNAVTGGLLKVSKEKFLIIKRILESSSQVKEDSKQESEINLIFKILIKGGFLVPHNLNEIERLKVKIRRGRYSPEWLYLTIVPTLNCNFRCVYCYEPQKGSHWFKQHMTGEVRDSLKQFVLNNIKKLNLLNIVWFGGEPLLNLKCVEELNTEFANICQEHSVEFKSHLVTNGYLLSKKIAQRLRKSFVQSVQITLDGPKEIHDKRRFLKNNKGTFDRIMDNIYPAVEVFGEFNVGIRVNIDHSNLEEIKYLLDLMEKREFKNKIIVDFGQVEFFYTDSSWGSGLKSYCITSSEFAEMLPVLYRELRLRGFKFPRVQRPGIANCVAEVLNAFVVGPRGELYKCWRETGNENNIVGYILPNGSLKCNFKVYKWLSFEIFDDPKCLKCKRLPICMGDAIINVKWNKK